VAGTITLDNYNAMISIDEPDDSFYTDYGDAVRRQRQNSLQSINSQHQPLSEQTDKDIFNFHRFVGFTFWGFSMAFVQVAWYWVLNHLFTTDPTFVSVLERVLSDQLCFSPVSLFCFFSYSNFVLEGGDKVTLNEKIKKIYLSTLAANYMVWPLVQFINFLVMPRRFQVPFSSSGE
jgi:protein Mpv17